MLFVVLVGSAITVPLMGVEPIETFPFSSTVIVSPCAALDASATNRLIPVSSFRFMVISLLKDVTSAGDVLPMRPLRASPSKAFSQRCGKFSE